MPIAGNHFAVGREVDITVTGYGRIQINEIMIYEVKAGLITRAWTIPGIKVLSKSASQA